MPSVGDICYHYRFRQLLSGTLKMAFNTNYNILNVLKLYFVGCSSVHCTLGLGRTGI